MKYPLGWMVTECSVNGSHNCGGQANGGAAGRALDARMLPVLGVRLLQLDGGGGVQMDAKRSFGAEL